MVSPRGSLPQGAVPISAAPLPAAPRPVDVSVASLAATVAPPRPVTSPAAPVAKKSSLPLIAGGAIVTAELANLAVDQCELIEERFTLIAPDNYRSDYLEVKLWGGRGEELAAESLYVEEE